jgi:hypothetical protein
MRLFLITVNIVHSSPILVTIKMEAILSTEMSDLKRLTRRNVPEDDILHIRGIALTSWALYRRHVFPVRYKLRFMSQKTQFFIVTAVKTSPCGSYKNRASVASCSLCCS